MWDQPLLFCEAKPTDSRVLKTTCAGLEVVREGCMYRIGNGEKINFWKDVWLKSSAPIDQLNENIPRGGEMLRVYDVINDEGRWDLNRVLSLVPQNIITLIKSILVGLNHGAEDQIMWKYSNSGMFSVKSAYSMLALPEIHSQMDWKWLWKCLGPEKIKFLLWLACRGRLHTQQLRA